MAHCLVYITASGPEEARRIGRALVAARLAACANVYGGVTSIFWWEGEVQQSHETILIAKTRAALVDRLTERVTELHPYDCPCVVSLAIDGGNKALLDWIDSETA